MTEDARQRIVAALLKQERRKRGRPKKPYLSETDTRRAALVVWALSEFPGAFRNRREVIRFLQALEKMAKEMQRQGQLKHAPSSFPQGNLEQSVSRGMNQHHRLLLECEKLAKKSR
jgi:hypothetical protein